MRISRAGVTRSRQRLATAGQAATEYILLIGVLIVILIALVAFRDKVAAYTQDLADWLDGQSVSPPPPKPPPPPAPAKPSPPAEQPPPTKPPMTPEDWATWLQGNWCQGPTPNWTGNKTGPGVVNGYPVTSLGPDSFRFTHPSNPNDYTDYERLPDGTFRMTYRNLTPNQPVSAPWRRC